MITSSITYLSPQQLRARWGFCEESIRRIIREGRLPGKRIGRRVRVSLADIEAYERNHGGTPAQSRTQLET